MMRSFNNRTLLVVVGLLLAAGVVGLLLTSGSSAQSPSAFPRPSRFKLDEIPVDGQRAYEYLKQICAIGPRPSGSRGMEAQQQLVGTHFEKLGGKVYLQKFRARHPRTGEPVAMANLIVQWRPQSRTRLLLCAHYDTRPLPDQDPVNPRGTFVGANDGASGTALLMELGHHVADLPGEVGLDFVLFDAEEFVFEERDPYFIGSEKFARSYVEHPPSYRYRWGVLLDMIGDADLQIYQDYYSVSWRETRPLVESIWRTAARLGVSEFATRRGRLVRDDHLSLRNIGKIPTCDIIDFDYPHWHTTGDTEDKCSALSLAKVGWVVLEWMKVEMKK